MDVFSFERGFFVLTGVPYASKDNTLLYSDLPRNLRHGTLTVLHWKKMLSNFQVRGVSLLLVGFHLPCLNFKRLKMNEQKITPR